MELLAGTVAILVGIVFALVFVYLWAKGTVEGLQTQLVSLGRMTGTLASKVADLGAEQAAIAEDLETMRAFDRSREALMRREILDAAAAELATGNLLIRSE